MIGNHDIGSTSRRYASIDADSQMLAPRVAEYHPVLWQSISKTAESAF